MSRFKKCNWKSSPETRRIDAETRQMKRDDRSDKKQLKVLNGRPGESKREREKLALRLIAQEA